MVTRSLAQAPSGRSVSEGSAIFEYARLQVDEAYDRIRDDLQTRDRRHSEPSRPTPPSWVRARQYLASWARRYLAQSRSRFNPPPPVIISLPYYDARSVRQAIRNFRQQIREREVRQREARQREDTNVRRQMIVNTELGAALHDMFIKPHRDSSYTTDLCNKMRDIDHDAPISSLLNWSGASCGEPDLRVRKELDHRVCKWPNLRLMLSLAHTANLLFNEEPARKRFV